MPGLDGDRIRARLADARLYLCTGNRPDLAEFADAAPTAQSYAVYDEVVTSIDAELQKLSQIMKTDVPAFNQLVRDQNIPAVVVK